MSDRPAQVHTGLGHSTAHASELLTIIVPAYNEVRTIRPVVERLLSIGLPVEREILVIDDGSTDGTRDVLIGIVNDGLGVEVIHAPRNAGKGSAIRLGLQQARGTIVAIQDADLELDPEQIAALVTPIVERRTDVVYGSRFLAGDYGGSFLSGAANRLLTALTNVLFGSALTDMETCYKVMRADVARSLRIDARRFDVEPQITARLLRSGHRILELPVRFNPRSRQQGKKIGWRDGVIAVQTLVRERWR